jgi:hypothetical protein
MLPNRRRFIAGGIHESCVPDRASFVWRIFSLSGCQPLQKARNVVVTATGAAMIIGGASILLGIKPKLGTAAIIGFLAGVSPVMHDFWRIEDPNQRINDMVNFAKNMALLGAALALMGVEEPWPASLPAAQPRNLGKVIKFARWKLAA